MQYSQGTFGRVFLIKFEDKDDLLAGLKEIAVREWIRGGVILLLGALSSAGVVVGPKQAVIPPDPVWTNFQDGREVLGIGTLFWKDDEPAIHLHGAVGRENETLVGCIRKDSAVYLVIEAVIAEIQGIDACRALDPKAGVVALELRNKKARPEG